MDYTSTSCIFEKNIVALEGRFPELAGKVKLAERSSSLYDVEISNCTEGAVLYINGQCMDHPMKPKMAAKNWVTRELRDNRFASCDSIVVFDSGCGYHLEALFEATEKKISLIALDAYVLRKVLENRDFTEILNKLEKVFFAGEEDFSSKSELLVRPQIQVIASEIYAKLRSKFYSSRGFSALHPKIGVLGPTHGGTGPIAAYTARALVSLGERAHFIEMSNFNAPYQAIPKLLNNPDFQKQAQTLYTDTLAEFVLQALTERPVDILICLSFSPVSAKLLTELKRRGVITVLWFVEDYQRFTMWQFLAPYFDFVFTIQKGDCIEAIKKAGCQEVHYLPTGCDPVVHRPMTLSPAEQERWGSPISFVGAGYHNRKQAFSTFANMPFKIWGTEWPECKPFDRMVQEGGRRLTPEEYVKIFNATKININLHSSTERDGVDPNGDFLNPRTFELACTGGFQLVDSRTLLPEAFTPGVDIVTFNDILELREKAEYYLAHEDERQMFIEKSRETALKKHTYQHRLKEMLSVIYSRCYESLQRRAETSLWHAVLERTKKYPDQELYKRCLAAYEKGEEPGLDGLVSDIVVGQGSLTETEEKLLILFHISKSIIRVTEESRGLKVTM